jgi:hypothetical protein
VRYIAAITVGLCQWLPEYWALTQQRLPALAAIGDAASAVERGMAASERSVSVLLSLYRSAVQSVLADPAASGLTHTGLLSLAAELAGGCQALQQAGAAGVAAPLVAVECLQQLAQRAILASLAQLSASLAAAVSALCAAEDFRLTHASRRAGAPATARVAALQQLVQGGMLHLKAALAEAARAEVNPLRKSVAPAREAFFCCFSAFAAATDSLATSLLVQQLGGTGATQVRGQRACCLLLGCCSPCCAVCLHGVLLCAGYRWSSHAMTACPCCACLQSLAAEAAAAAAVVASSAGGSSSREAAALSPTRRLLVLCANLGAVRGRLLPQQFSRWAALLQAGSGGGAAGKELQAAVQACAAELEAAETRLASAYIDRKQVRLFARQLQPSGLPPCLAGGGPDVFSCRVALSSD